MVRKCFICHRQVEKGSPYALHKFPKDKKLLEQWKVQCGLRAEDDTCKLLICSLHFTKEDCIGWKGKETGGRLSLKSTAIPCILKPDVKPCIVAEKIEVSDVKKDINVECNNDTSLLDTKASSTVFMPKCRESTEPQHVNDVTRVAVKSSQRRERTVQMLKEAIRKKTHQLRMVQQQNRRLKKRIKELKDLKNHVT